jgi:hypothetical protein
MGPGFVLGEAGLAPLFDRAFLKMEGSVKPYVLRRSIVEFSRSFHRHIPRPEVAAGLRYVTIASARPLTQFRSGRPRRRVLLLIDLPLKPDAADDGYPVFELVQPALVLGQIACEAGDLNVPRVASPVVTVDTIC